MPQYKLTYFNFRCRAEVARLLFAEAEVKYEDIRYEYSDWPGKIKESLVLPYGQLPTLSVDGTVYCQSLCIARYLAEKFGLAGKTAEDKFRADMVAHCIEDTLIALDEVFLEEDPQVKEKKLAKFKKDKFHQSCEMLEKLLKQNGGGDGYFVGDSLTFADLSLLTHIDTFLPMIGIEAPSYIDGYPKLKALFDRVSKQPKIAAWIAVRPKTDL